MGVEAILGVAVDQMERVLNDINWIVEAIHELIQWIVHVIVPMELDSSLVWSMIGVRISHENIVTPRLEVNDRDIQQNAT